VTQSSTKTYRHPCPRCGSRLVPEGPSEKKALLASLLLLRRFRCTTQCGWRGLRFSRSRFRKSKKKIRFALIVLLFVLAAAYTVRCMLPRVGAGGSHDEGIQEVE
jgi:hypothetical protein